MIPSGDPSLGRPTIRQRFLGWCVHCYTALGLIAAALIAVLLVDGRPESFRRAFLLMLVATLIDATDGMLARRVRIKEVLPGFDGRRLDDLVDFLTYTCLPLLLIWRAHLLPEGWEICLLLPLLASAYGFCQASAKTDDGYFLGFPSYWNLVAFYLYVLRPPPPWFSLGVLVVLSVLTFVPSRYLYPSQRGRLNWVTNVLGGVWALLLAWILWDMPAEIPADGSTRRLALGSLFFPAWYLGASWTISVRLWRRHSAVRAIPKNNRGHSPLKPSA
ncbi:MAG TPA: CDP-alcohol phosphatidyltransferase family protein [Gemmataceae bacterium]|jgi:phosphatidylcholine synthase